MSLEAENKVTPNDVEIVTILLGLLVFLCILVVSTEIESVTIRSQKCSVPYVVSAMFRGTNLAVPYFDFRLEVVSRHSLHH